MGVKNWQFWDDTVYGRPLNMHLIKPFPLVPSFWRQQYCFQKVYVMKFYWNFVNFTSFLTTKCVHDVILCFFTNKLDDIIKNLVRIIDLLQNLKLNKINLPFYYFQYILLSNMTREDLLDILIKELNQQSEAAKGGFQLLDLIMMELKSHMTC